MKPLTHSIALSLLVLFACDSGAPTGDAQNESNPPDATSSRVPKADPPPTEAAWYENEIRAFEQADAASQPAPGQVLFIGSSSIRLWKTLAEDMAPMPVLNRGFGGSKTPEVLAVFDRIVTPYAPTVVVYYCGDNDLGTDNHDAEGAAAGFITFDRRARASWPDVEVFYIPIKASLARWKNWESMRQANGFVQAYCEKTAGAHYLDTVTPTLTAEGTPDPSIFLKDGLHLNAKGYALWTNVVRDPVLMAWQRRTR
ncbi:MAG: GDSL family lipase [Planctomycetes bacterium]|nr:GDSL family lipase [Planctomycetota bacterium]